MGGKALKNVSVVRLDKEDYVPFETRVLSLLRTNFPTGDFRPVKYFSDKPDFGDMDILYSFKNEDPMKNQFLSQVEKIIEFEFKNYLENSELPVFKNGDVTSIGFPFDKVNYFQVDLIKSNESEIDFAEFYFSYNDMGNLMGRISKFLNLKLGHKGMYYVFRPTENIDYVFSEVLITKDKDVAMDILGFNKEDYYSSELNTLEDVFNFILSSDFMIKEIYLSENQNSIARKREKKRESYKRFMNFLDNETEFQGKYSLEDKEKLRRKVFNKILTFPDFMERLEEVKHQYKKQTEFQEKFNGRLVSEITGLEGKELGEFIQKFKKYIETENKKDFKDYILSVNKETIKKDILSLK